MKNILIIFAILLFNIQAYAGWKIIIIEEMGGSTNEVTIYFQDNKMKVSGDEMGEFIYDLNSGMLTLINRQSKTYWQGTPEEMVNEMKEMMDEMMRQAGMDPDEMKEDQPEMEKEKIKVEIRKIGDEFEAAGYTGALYEVYGNGELEEKVWQCEDIDISSDFDIKRFNEITTMIEEQSNISTLDSSEEYKDFMSRGFYVKSVQISNGEEVSVSTLKEASEINIPDSEFNVPSSYQKKGMMELMMMMNEDH